MRGCERKIIMLKGTDSEIFDEAYFLLRRDFKGSEGQDEIVREAQRIVDINTTRTRKRSVHIRDAVFFVIGIAAGTLAAIILKIIF